MRCYIFDIDGTLADCSHRLHHIQKQPKDWDGFFADCVHDKPIVHMVDLAVHLSNYWPLVFVSGRSDVVRSETVEWLRAHHLDGDLFMRHEGDHRPDDVVKSDLLDRIMAGGWHPIMSFDDRNRVVAMWRSRGIPCAQVADGDF